MVPITIPVDTMMFFSMMFILSWRIISNIHVANAFTSSKEHKAQHHRYYARNFMRATRVSILQSSTNADDNDDLSLPNVLCVGETLWDSLPSGIYLGGAPSNVAVHLAYLFNSPSSSSTKKNDNNSSNRPTVAIAACLGKDQLGKEAKRRLELNGVRVDYIQFHPEWETGMATAILDSNGDATYEFNTPAAWDGLSCFNDSNLAMLVQQLSQQQTDHNKEQKNVFVIGTIAGRLQNDHGATSLSTLMSVRNTAPEGTVILDINLRSPWYEKKTVLELARGASETKKKKLALLKVNEEELAILEQWCGIEETIDAEEGGDESSLFGDAIKARMEALAETLNAQRICVTRGDKGAALWCDKTVSTSTASTFDESSGYSSPNKSNDSDTVGAGDSFLASLINSLFIRGEDPDKALQRACALGGYVASCRGATPAHGDAPDALKSIFSG